MEGSYQWHSAPGFVTKRALQTPKSFDPKSLHKCFSTRAECFSIRKGFGLLCAFSFIMP